MSTGFFVAFLIDIFSYCFATQKSMNKKKTKTKNWQAALSAQKWFELPSLNVLVPF